MRWVLIFAGLSGAIAVGLGAYAAHGMESTFGEIAVSRAETALRYQSIHTLALLALFAIAQTAWGQARGPRKGLAVSALAFCLGILLFSGSLLMLAFAGPSSLGAVAPIGGIALIFGWLCLAGCAVFRGATSNTP